MSDSAGLLVIAVILVLAAGLFACADAAISAVSRARVEGMVRAGRPGARQLLAVVTERPRHINLLLLLRLSCELAATVLVTVACLRLIRPAGLAGLVAGLGMIVVSYVLVGVGPRTLGRQHPYRAGLIMAGAVRVLGSVLGPLSRLLIMIGNAITPGRGFREGPFTSEVELRELVDMAEERGVVDADEREMIHSVFELSDTIAREVMVPRTEMVWIEVGKSVRQCLALSLRTGYTRLPVIGESVDDIVGVVNLKDLVRGAMESTPDGLTVGELMVPAAFVPDTKRLDDLLREMQLSRNHLAIAVDEYGGTAGLLTIEDILEEIVGEITDEYDDEQPPIEQLDADTARVTARLALEDLGELFGLQLPVGDDVETVGGWLAQALGRVPIPGSTATVNGLELTAESVGGRRNRVDSVLVHRLPPRDAEPTAPSAASSSTVDSARG